MVLYEIGILGAKFIIRRKDPSGASESRAA
jgi:hypothetical protein